MQNIPSFQREGKKGGKKTTPKYAKYFEGKY